MAGARGDGRASGARRRSRSPPLFAPLPPATVEYLAGRAERRRVAAGATIVRQGERGDAFYVVADGVVEVSSDGAAPRELAAGDFFGEIALLRSVPRTATVVAKTDAELLELAGTDFVEAVTGHARRARAADAVVFEARAGLGSRRELRLGLALVEGAPRRGKKSSAARRSASRPVWSFANAMLEGDPVCS